MVDTNPQRIEEILTRGIENVYPSREELEKVLLSGKKLKIYNGIDPTGKLHIGHAAVLLKLRQLQDLGHEIIILIGDFTATIGDPTGKSETRKVLTKKQVLANAKNYKKQIGKILDFKKSNVKFFYNGKWTNKLKMADLFAIASHFTVARLLERDMFQKRIKKGGDIHVPEFLYPIFQAYDSVAMDVDMEVGGNDQTFNMLAGRTLMKKMKNKEKFVLTTKLLVDSVGKKMGKTEGNMVNLDESPAEMFGKIMSWPDELIHLTFEICTRVAPDEIDEIIKIPNPRNQKAILAKEIVKMYHGEKEAKKAEEEFDKVFRNKELPTDIPVFQTDKNNYFVLDLLFDAKLSFSKNEAKRLVEGGGVEIQIGEKKEKVADWEKEIIIEDGMIIKVGRKFVKIKLKT
ncbi:MAG: tyrosine--tRNA ligase [Candidatus Staskawiczbacteria bacterium RIFOXYC1_FULL_37_43]|nr:MAG: tyrosine--tRNA ligase [Candidatus Staskawiczbacteria bacterium RIFCSPHIGHO2_01_FULL_37_17]OGZ71245.1 MAG: tyrosine--tRNA ligase [Candidatus Staskawiczbacteria bacterium RIFCSPLOWO2_01_FULL_37_19]OGZ75615.1 MAG: tyrosine--tRNA ligase [Candidatus Staskawiczbacteria bacterium RIFOXYA1_FULL_37_15]OGZ76608.1 MAG: tyrosine--tRNA ligase [Candidatus Staskawiczbacteria bacterium RIFOXYA12_FULL_37_10]OGZ79891.1 MAG: tyrosine--tRNA ligase [Candidatus Staskawiczbacteria bacterium RIFOXYB1_FULL_38_3